MPELSQKERLQLSLLDRLSDDEPNKHSESMEKRVISVTRLKELVQRDLSWLLNTTSSAAHLDFSHYPEVKNSVLNFGIPEMSGLLTDSVNMKRLEREITHCIKCYEPRIIAPSLQVKVTLANQEMNENTLSFQISADVWAKPIPLQLFLQSSVDVENGHVHIEQWQLKA